MNILQPDALAKAFNDHCPVNWRARPYLKTRVGTTAFNVVSFKYKNGMVSFNMDCAKPIGQGFMVKFHNFVGAFGDYVSAIQKGLFRILLTLERAGYKMPFALETPNALAFALRKDGSVMYLYIVEEAQPELDFVPVDNSAADDLI